jgi:hypothetical protein
MKTNFYLLLILLLSFSVANAQSTTPSNKVEVKIAVSETENVNNSDVEIIETLELKEIIARTSDIRSFLNRERKVENIKLVFPKINKARKA